MTTPYRNSDPPASPSETTGRVQRAIAWLAEYGAALVALAIIGVFVLAWTLDLASELHGLVVASFFLICVFAVTFISGLINSDAKKGEEAPPSYWAALTLVWLLGLAMLATSLIVWKLAA